MPELSSASWNEARACFHRQGDGFVTRDSNAGDVVAEIADDRLDIHRDDRLVLDDENLGTSLVLDLGQGIRDQIVDFAGIDLDQIRGVLRRETFHRGQQQRLTRQRGHPGEASACDGFVAFRVCRSFVSDLVEVRRVPDRLEHPVQAETGIDVAGKFFGCGDDRLERGAHIFVAVHLAAGQGPAIAPQKWKVRCKLLSKRHG
jgi:hypothetical protein